MKKIFLTALILFIYHITSAQIQNVNPDPNGEPWYVGGLRVPSQEELAKIPVVNLSHEDLQRSVNSLPAQLDNSTQPYFRPIFNQSNGSCAQSSGVAYNFTYEINRRRGTSAAISQNQFPSHYTYDFLNDGDGDNGSWYTDGWDIIKANGCPNIQTYGGDLDTGGPQRWMSGYDKYESGMGNRVKEYFAIDVSTPDGLLTLKHWMYDHLEGASTGSLVNFAAGIGNSGYNKTSNDIITSWGFPSNHAMTFVGWDDNIYYDYNNDGQITNNIDITGDGIVDMRDWERGAMIMVNSWGTYWANNGKAYVMYRTLASGMTNGGIVGKKVFAVRVKNTQTPQLTMRVKMSHNNRKMIKISAGVATNTNAGSPEHTIDFPLFNRQGGAYPMQGTSNSPIEFSLDISKLLNYISPGDNAKFFLIVNENDPNNNAYGQIYDFAIVDHNGLVSTCPQHNVNIQNNTDTILAITASPDFGKPEITTTSLPAAMPGQAYSQTLQAINGSPEYTWNIVQNYNELPNTNTFPNINSNTIATDNDDDGFGVQNLDFEFPFYGKNYQTLYILTDGSIRFDSGFDYLRNEDAIKSNKVISAFASDLMIYPADGDAIYYEGDTTHATFRWKTSLFDNQAANVDVAVTLYPNGEIKFFYNNGITTDLDWASGISDGNGNFKILSNSGISDPSGNKFILQPEPYPTGMFISPGGDFQGTVPNEINTWPIHFKVIDNNDVSQTKTIDFTTDTSGIEQENIFHANFYPNPVSSTGTLTYKLDKNEKVHIDILDLQGKKVANLLQKNQAPGIYKLIWHPHLSKGMYIYRIKTTDRQQTGKVIIQ